MTYRVAYDISETALPNVDAAVKFLDERPLRIATHGKRAASYWFAELARVSVETAHHAVVQYVSTGQRPTCVEWVTGG